jgi:hypothetical protein
MADQTPDQGRSESRLSREVVCPCGFSLPLGPVLLSCVRVTNAVEKTVDQATEGEIGSQTGKKAPFHQRDDGLAVLMAREGPYGVVAGGRSTVAKPDSGWKQSRIGDTAAQFRIKKRGEL